MNSGRVKRPLSKGAGRRVLPYPFSLDDYFFSNLPASILALIRTSHRELPGAMSSFGRRIRMSTAALVAAVLLVQPPLSAQRPEVGEDGVKAAVLYNFTKFIDWPPSAFAAASSPFVVCAYADAGFRKTLEEILQGEQVRGRPITVAARESEDAQGCHMLYLSKDATERQARILAPLRQTPVLSVGEGRPFLEQGGLIAFVLENDRVRFAVNKRGVDAAGLTISSQLLRVARRFDGMAP